MEKVKAALAAWAAAGKRQMEKMRGSLQSMAPRTKRLCAGGTALVLAVVLCAAVGSAAYKNGYAQGQDAGAKNGYAAGRIDGTADGRSAGYDEGHTAGYNEGRNKGYLEGKDFGYHDGYSAGYNAAVDEIGAAIQKPAASSSAAQPAAPSQPSAPQNGEKKTYVLNKRTKTVHEEDCLFVDLIRSKDKEYTGDLQSALKQGYSRCPVCDPD